MMVECIETFTFPVYSEVNVTTLIVMCRDAPILMPKSGVGTNTGVEYFTNTHKICVDTTTSFPVVINVHENFVNLHLHLCFIAVKPVTVTLFQKRHD